MNLEEKIFTREQLAEIPNRSGVYLFRGRRVGSEKDEILYVGKALNLRARVRQYFVKDGDGRAFSKVLQAAVNEIKTIVVMTEDDAYLLENELIKKNKPPYNIMLKDDKRYLSLRLDTNHEWPRIEIVRKIKDKATYLGPFSSSTRLRSTLDFMQRIFPLRTCDDRKLYNRARPCIEYEIKRCVAPCVKYVTPTDYSTLVTSALLFLKGRSVELLVALKSRMEEAVAKEDFELAAKIRDQLQAIETTQQGQSVIGLRQFQDGANQDALGFSREGRRAVVTLLFVRSGIIIDKRTFEFIDSLLTDEDLQSEFLNRYYSEDVFIPDEIIVSREFPTLEKLNLIVPRSEEKKNFLKLAQENARIVLDNAQIKANQLEGTLTKLRAVLNLENFPRVIDCIDISHHQGAETVAAVVRFENGRPQKSGYRKIKLKVEKVDDFQSIREALSRRYKSEEDLPNLLVIDGGRGQLSSAKEVLVEKAWVEKLDLVGLAKGREEGGVDPRNPKDRERVFKAGQKNPILLKKDSAEEHLLSFLRDEAHRFAITFHRQRKDDGMSLSVLDSIPGISDKTKIKLLRAFGSTVGIRDASDEELRRCVSARVLKSLREALKLSIQ